MSVEKQDLDVQLNLGVVCRGKMCDLLKIREFIRSLPNVEMPFHTMSAEYLFMMKKSALTPEQLKKFEKEAKR